MRRTYTGSRILLPAKCPTAYWCPTLGITIQSKRNLATAAKSEDCPKSGLHGRPCLLQTQFRSKRYLVTHKTSIYGHRRAAGATQESCFAGPGTTQVTATQWLIFYWNVCFISRKVSAVLLKFLEFSRKSPSVFGKCFEIHDFQMSVMKMFFI